MPSQACSATIAPGASGACECRGLTDRQLRSVRRSTCDHTPFTCEDECQRAAHYACVAWRATQGCTADGPRLPTADQPCDAEPPEQTAGYCECGGGRRVPRPPRCGGDAVTPGASSSCDDECARGESLYEVLGLAEG